MNKNIVIGGLVALALLFAGLYFFGGGQQFGTSSGPTHYSQESFLQGLTGGTRGQFVISNTGALTASGAITTTGNVTVTTSNTATSTITVGCIQMYATSTATAVKLVPAQYATTTLGFNGGTTGLAVIAQYGTCP